MPDDKNRDEVQEMEIEQDKKLIPNKFYLGMMDILRFLLAWVMTTFLYSALIGHVALHDFNDNHDGHDLFSLSLVGLVGAVLFHLVRLWGRKRSKEIKK